MCQLPKNEFDKCYMHSKFKWVNLTSMGKFKLQIFLVKITI